MKILYVDSVFHIKLWNEFFFNSSVF